VVFAIREQENYVLAKAAVETDADGGVGGATLKVDEGRWRSPSPEQPP